MRLWKYVPCLSALVLSLPAHASEGGMPQMDTAMFPEQIFWLIICFGILYVLMAYVALPGVAQTQRNRKHVIAAEIHTAHAANEDARHAIAQIEKMLTAARAKAQADMMNMLAEVNAETATRKAAQEKELMRRLHEAEAAIAVARETALASISKNATELATIAVEKVSGTRARVLA